MKPRWDRITLLLGLWAFVGLLLSVEVFFTLRVMNPAVLYVDVAVSQFQRAALWVVLAPLVLWLGKCVPFESGKKFRATLFHLTLSLVIMAVYYLARLLYAVQEEHVPWSDFWNVAQSSFFGRNLIDTVYYWAVLALGYVYQLQQGYREKELRSAQLEARLAEAELQVLKRQLQPHFLFNTMNTIAVLVREGDNQKAVQLIAKLSSLLRLSLDSERSVETNLRGELEFLRLYVEIQKARFPDRLQYRVEIPEELLDRRVPSLLLQPLVENAIIH